MSTRKRKSRIISLTGLLAVVALLVIIVVCNTLVDKAAEGKLYWSTKDVPYNKVGLLLGTTKYTAGGGINPYYQYRIEAAVRLLKAGKIKYIIVSGANPTKNYNEPREMQQDLIEAGVDSSRIFLDYAGLRTFDSVVRLQAIFGQDSVTFISQPFHNERAIYIAQMEGISAIGYNARDLDRTAGIKVQARERLARVKVFVDYIIGQEPKYLGKPITIPE